jgi:hypothetical protein
MQHYVTRDPCSARATRILEEAAAERKSPLPATLVLPFASFNIEGNEIRWKTLWLSAPYLIA